ncbi:response regulator transcription factor [Demequina soli]|uniref:response regulator transcription factor n=1 Tax=Demequina soli TaxID=1638987 RepID=UPI000783AA23|nr:response regulator transcription factor [Demequina soli]
MIAVLLVDDQEMLRAGLRTILEAHADIEVAGEVGDGLSAVRAVETQHVDVVLLDLRMPGIDGVETTRRLRARDDGGPRILVLTTFDEDANVLAALRAGADGFLSKGAGPRELTDAIVAVAEGRHALCASAVGALVGHVSETPARAVDEDKARLFAALTDREREVVGLIVEGLDNIEISKRIFISPFTVKTHANRAMMKVHARDRAQLVSFAVQAGIAP